MAGKSFAELFKRALGGTPDDADEVLSKGGWTKSEDGKGWSKDGMENIPTPKAYKLHKSDEENPKKKVKLSDQLATPE